MKKFLCRVFGHKFDLVDKTVLEIEQKAALNKESFKNEFIRCQRCEVKCSFITPN